MVSIKKEVARGVFWIALAKYSGIIISLGITAILARNISPEAFGTMAIATVIMLFLDIFSDMGIGAAIVQFKTLTRKQLDTLFTLGLCIGGILSFILFLSSGNIAEYYGDPSLTDVCRYLCICLFFNALNIVPNGLMLREKRFRTIALRTLSIQIVSGSIAVAGALHGWGIYALLVTPVLSSVGVFIVNYCNYPQSIVLRPDSSAIRTVWSYSIFQFLFSVSNYFSRNMDKLIIGRYFTMADLGYYDKSYRLMQLPLQNITYVISPVLHPILSAMQSDKQQLARKNSTLIGYIACLSFPIGICLFFGAHDIVNILFGDRWEPSVPVFRILALSLPLQMILSTSGALFQAAGKTDHMFYVGIMNTVVTVAGFLIAALGFGTLTAIAWAWDITLLINFVNSYTIMYRCTFKSRVQEVFRVIMPQFVNTAIVGILAAVLFRYVSFQNIFGSLAWIVCSVFLLTFIMAALLRQYNILLTAKKLLFKSANTTFSETEH
ncbi:MAG: lipopolysaccharide biosynthesis protein [Alistipes sp.]|nr:lipopolysaccharide biosynthesis protein [Alistipes sp.]